MATLYVTPHKIVKQNGENMVIGPKVGAGQAVTVSTSTAKTASAVPANADYVLLSADADMFVEIGPQATVAAVLNTSIFLKGGLAPVAFHCSKGDGVAGITGA